MTRMKISVALMSMLVCAALLVAASAPVGTWDCTSSAPGGGEMNWTLTLKQVDGKLVGTAGNDQGEIAIDEAKYENDTLTFKVSLDSGTYDVTMKFDGDKVDGNWKGSGETGTIKGSKKA
jgi:hypothetical protein